jgi:hypothetical protein
VINSPEVYFGIKRQHGEVGHKNINIFTYKNHLDRFCRNGKQFFKKDMKHNFVQFLSQELVITHHIPKLDTEDLWILRYHRSRLFTFLFFMPKMSRNILGEYKKSCSTLRYKSTKFFLHFSEFSTIFWRIYKIQ